MRQEIPAMTDPLGKYWEQPNPKYISVDETHALMDENSFKQLKNYSHTTPTGVYQGKMWKAQGAGKWFLCWYVDKDEKTCIIEGREILVI